MNWQTIMERLHEMFPSQYRSNIEEFINSKSPKTAADVEHWLQQYNYHNKNHWLEM